MVVASLEEARRLRAEGGIGGFRVVSCGMHACSLVGLRVPALFATPAARTHKRYGEVVDVLRVGMLKTRAPFEQVF